MKLTTLRRNDALRPGVVLGEDVLDLVAARNAFSSEMQAANLLPSTMRSLIESGAEGLAVVRQIEAAAGEPATRARLAMLGALVPFEKASFGPVIPDGNMVLAGSMNSLAHLKEMATAAPPWPCAFIKVRSALAGSGEEIVAPPGHDDMVDWEGEFCVVIGRRCHRVGAAEAMDYVMGYTLLNDISARNYVPQFFAAAKDGTLAVQVWDRNVLGKNFPTFAPIGPVIATCDEFPAGFGFHMETLVNGVVMQSSTETDLVFGPAEMIAHFSNYYVFEPGDIISLGSPPGVGVARRPPVFLHPGDLVEVRVKEIGILGNRVAAVTGSA